MAQGINLAQQITQLPGALASGIQAGQKIRGSQLASLMKDRQLKIQERQTDLAEFKQLNDQLQPIITEMATNNPEQVEGFIDQIKSQNADLFNRLGLQNMKVFSRKPKDVAVKIDTVVNENNIEQLSATAKDMLGFVPETLKIGAPFTIISDERGNQEIDFRQLNTKEMGLIQKKIIELRGKGAKDATQQDIQSLPEEALIRLGDTVLVAPPNDISPEGSTKLAFAMKAADDAESLLSDMNTGKLTRLDLAKATTPGLRKLGTKNQMLFAKLDALRESLGRALSGAALPETEVGRFRSLFSVTPFDTVETARFKVKRSIETIREVDKLVRFGKTSLESTKNLLSQAEKDLRTIQLQSNVPSSNVAEFSDQKAVEDQIKAGKLRAGDQIIFNGKLETIGE